MSSLLRCRHLEPILTGFKFTTVGGASVTVDKGSNDFPSGTCGAAGKALITQTELALFARGPIVIVTPGADVADAGIGTYDTDPADGAITVELLGSAGSGDDGTGYALVAGFGNTDTDRFDDSQKVKSTINDPKLMGWLITNNGTIAKSSGGRQADVVRTSEGIVTFTLTPAMANYRAFAVCPIQAAARHARITSADGETVVVKITDTSGTVQDTDFVLLGLYSGQTDEGGQTRDIVEVPQLASELVVGKILNTAGTPSIVIGGATDGVDFTITDNGVGDISIDLVRAAGRVILPVVTAEDSHAQLLATPDTDTARFGIFDSAGVAADDSFNFIILQYETDDTQEF